MAVTSDVPYAGFHFTADLGDGQPVRLFEALIPESRLERAEYRDGNQPDPGVRTLDTFVRYGNLILRRGARGSLDWHEWWKQSITHHPDAFRSISVSLLDGLQKPVMTWIFKRARPVAHSFTPLNALTGGVLTESIEIAFDAMGMQ